jgi:hypothetical protein
MCLARRHAVCYEKINSRTNAGDVFGPLSVEPGVKAVRLYEGLMLPLIRRAFSSSPRSLLTVKPLTGYVGAEIHGVDLTVRPFP